MSTLHRYLFKDYLMNFFMSLAVTTLVLYLGSVMKGLDQISNGVAGGLLLQIFSLNIPNILTFSIPISTLVASVLLFGRLSVDGEITAMRSGGLGIWQIISPVVFCGVILSLICLVIHNEIAPESRYRLRSALLNVDQMDPIDLLDEGRFVRFPSLVFWISEKKGYDLKDVEIYELNDEGVTVQTLRAQTGKVIPYPEEKSMRVHLNEVQVLYPDEIHPEDLTRARVINMESYDFDLDFASLIRNNTPFRNIKDMRIKQLFTTVRHVDEYFPDLNGRRLEETRMKALVEIHKRLGLSMGCLSFALLGIPLGMTNRRKPSSKGIPIAVALVIIFYAFFIGSDSLRNFPWMFPDYLIWIPVICWQLTGIWLIQRIP